MSLSGQTKKPHIGWFMVQFDLLYCFPPRNFVFSRGSIVFPVEMLHSLAQVLHYPENCSNVVLLPTFFYFYHKGFASDH